MLKVSQSGFDKPLFPELTRNIQLLPDVLESEALDLAVQLEDELLNIFNDAPPRGNTVFIWSADAVKNKRARGWWFWQLKLGNIPTDGKHYIRQNKPPRGGKVTIEKTQNGLLIVFSNTWKKSGLLYGTFKEDTRLIGHKKTGWQWAAPKYKRAQKAFLKDLDSRILARLRSSK